MLCSKCKSNERDTKHSWCRKCKAHAATIRRLANVELSREKQRQWRKANPRGSKASQLKIKFGITIEQYDRMLVLQGGKCAICRQPETTLRNGKPKELAVDHNPVTGKVRQLLCGNCNQGLGRFKDSPDLLLAAFTYLEIHKQEKQ